MTGDFTRWLENETAAALTHDLPRPADPFACIPNASDDEYAGTELETPQQRAARERTAELFAMSDDPNWLGI